MAAVVNALSHNGRKHGQNDQANDNCWCIHRRSLLGRGGDGGNGEGVLVVLVSADKEVDQADEGGSGGDGADAEGDLAGDKPAELVDDEGDHIGKAAHIADGPGSTWRCSFPA